MSKYTICQCMDCGHIYSNLLKCNVRAMHVVNKNKIRFIVMPGESPQFADAHNVALIFMPYVKEIDVYDGKYINASWAWKDGVWVSLPAGHDLEGPQ